MAADLVVGYNGTCALHKGMPAIARDAKTIHGEMKTALLVHLPCGRGLVSKVLAIHCSTGHQYEAVQASDVIHDVLDEEEELRILEEEDSLERDPPED